ncbi:MAG TPA: ABC transporter ATP-binding protein [Jiangellaceae bacterium]|nr:ABC transporter ATP-binding protein [Jiangellaceae bacterium]
MSPAGGSAAADAHASEEVSAPPQQRRRRAIAAEDTLLSVRGLQVHFPIKSGVFVDRVVGWVKAVDGVDLDVPRGSTVGLVGESGCGKTTLGRSILRLVEPTTGTVTFDGIDVGSLAGEDLRRIRRRMQMIFQDPMASLDPRQSVESVLTEPRRAHGIKRDEATTVARLLDLVGLPASAANRYPHEFSGGQRQRIGIARAIALEPELIIADEPVSALDVSIQAQVVNLLEELQDRLGLTYVVIAHDLAVVRHIADVVAVMYLGGVVEQAPSDALYRAPYHPYTKALMSAVPIPDPVVEDSRERILLEGDLPSPANPPSGCRFHTRCPYRQPTRCDDEQPALRELAPGHTVACHWAEQIDSGEIAPRASAVVEAAIDAEPPPSVPIAGDSTTTTLGPPPGI